MGPARLHAPLARGGAGAEELDHVAVRVLHEELAQPGRPRDHVAAGEPVVLDAARGGVGVVGPEREVRIAGHDLRSLASRTSWSFRMMCSCRSPPRLYQMPGKSKAGRGISWKPRTPV